MQTYYKFLDIGVGGYAFYIANAKKEGLNHLFPLRPIYIFIVYVCIFMSCILYHM